MKKRGFFITFEGTDGVGKTTHIHLAAAWLKKAGFTVKTTREPGGGELAEKIRHLLLDPSLRMEPLTELFLYEASRVEHVQKVIFPALKKGNVVLCDRFTDATLAYQGHARGLMKYAVPLNEIATNNLIPDLTILLNLPPSQGLSRAKARTKNKKGDRLENEGLSFQKKVQKGYVNLAQREPKRVKVVTVQKNLEQTQQLIRAVLSRSLHGNLGPAPRSPISKRRP